MSKGKRKRNAARTKSGRLSRAGQTVTLDSRPSEWVQAQRKRFGQYYNSALGRAFAAGLLGEGNEAKDRYDAASRFNALYGRFLGKPGYRCPLDQSPRGADGIDMTISERQASDYEWLRVNMKRVDATGCEPFMAQLLSVRFTDSGPCWLDGLLGSQPDPRDRMVLDAAMKAIDAIGAVGRRTVAIADRFAA